VSTDLEVYEAPSLTLFRTDEPAEVVRAATKVADALAQVIEDKQLFKVISGKKHVLVEGWTLLGTMVGVFAVLDGDPSEVEVNGVKGWRATVKAVRGDGSVVGRASALCLRSEQNWRNRDEYAVMSMAQTRATSKALRQPLGFVMTLAGYAATPEAETDVGDGIEDGVIVDPDGRPFPDQRDPAPGQFEPPAGALDGDPNLATAAQLRNVNRLMGELVKQDETGQTTRDSLKAEVVLAYGVTSSKELTKKEASEIIDALALRAGEK
jgi:hypothetical protein